MNENNETRKLCGMCFWFERCSALVLTLTAESECDFDPSRWEMRSAQSQKFVPSPHLSDDINLKIMQSEKDGGLNLEDVRIGQSFNVQTKNTLYRFTKTADGEYEVSGHPQHCPEPIPCYINGSTWGGCMIKEGFVGINMHLEIHRIGQENPCLTTTSVQSIELL